MNTKTAYISVYRDGTGYGNFAENAILALDAAKIDVVPICVSLTNKIRKNNERILELEKKSWNGIDSVIQQLLPNFFSRKEGVKNIGMFFWETTSFRGSSWQHSCNLMDEIWVLTEEQKDACCKSGVKVPINIVRPARDFRFFDKKRDPIIFPSIIDDTYKFYTIGDASYRKNLFGLINTFLSEFSFDDNVSLVIKSFMEGKTHAEAASYVENAVKEIKDSLRKPEWSYPKIVFLEKRFSDEEMCSLHQSCDCFVSSSRGEGDGMPALDAACFGNITITPSWNGTRETFESTNHISIKNLLEKTVVFPNQPLANLYNPDETWFEPSSKEIALAMREVYENPDKYKKIAQEEILNLESRFSLEESGRVMGNLLKNG